MTLTEIKNLVERSKKLADKAAHGPWECYRRDGMAGDIHYDIEQESMQRIAFGVPDHDLPKAKPTSEFIAASREAVPQLCQIVELLLTDRESLLAAIRVAQDILDVPEQERKDEWLEMRDFIYDSIAASTELFGE